MPKEMTDKDRKELAEIQKEYKARVAIANAVEEAAIEEGVDPADYMYSLNTETDGLDEEESLQKELEELEASKPVEESADLASNEDLERANNTVNGAIKTGGALIEVARSTEAPRRTQDERVENVNELIGDIKDANRRFRETRNPKEFVGSINTAVAKSQKKVAADMATADKESQGILKSISAFLSDMGKVFAIMFGFGKKSDKGIERSAEKEAEKKEPNENSMRNG